MNIVFVVFVAALAIRQLPAKPPNVAAPHDRTESNKRNYTRIYNMVA